MKKTKMAAPMDDGNGSCLLFIPLTYFPHLTRPLTVNNNFDNSTRSGLQDAVLSELFVVGGSDGV